MEKFIVTPKEDKSVTMTIRIDRALQEEYNDLAAKTNRSRNELISMALQCALDHIDYSGPAAHLGRSLAQLDRASAHLIQSAFRHMPIADQPIY